MNSPSSRVPIYGNIISYIPDIGRFFIHDVAAGEAVVAKLENSFIIISLNRFQQIIGVHTFLAYSDQIKVNEFPELLNEPDMLSEDSHKGARIMPNA